MEKTEASTKTSSKEFIKYTNWKKKYQIFILNQTESTQEISLTNINQNWENFKLNSQKTATETFKKGDLKIWNAEVAEIKKQVHFKCLPNPSQINRI
jgi:predicted kinase